MSQWRRSALVAISTAMAVSLLGGVPAHANDPTPTSAPVSGSTDPTDEANGITMGESTEGSGQSEESNESLNVGAGLDEVDELEPGRGPTPTPVPTPTFTVPPVQDYSSPGTTKTLACNPSYDWDPKCTVSDTGWSFRAFKDMGRRGVGTAYDKGALPITITLKIEEHFKKGICTEREEFYIDDEGEKVVIKPERSYECPQRVLGWSTTRDANPRVTPATIDTRFNTRCDGRHTTPGVFVEGGRAYSTPFVGYKVKWFASASTSSTTSGFFNFLDTYECLPPATATQFNAQVCYRSLEGDIFVTMPNPMTPNGPTVGLPGRKTGSFPKWRIELPKQMTAYGRVMDEVINKRAAGASEAELEPLLQQAYYACMIQAPELTYNFDRDSVRDWGWGMYDAQIEAPYDIVSGVKFTDRDHFGGKPANFIVLDRSKLWDDNQGTQVSTYLDPAPDNQDRVWRNVTHMYCEPASKITNPEAAFASEDYINGVHYWRNGKKLPPGITYTANDCAPPDGDGGGGDDPSGGPGTPGDLPEGVNDAPATWGCLSDGFTTFANTTRGTTRLQSQADNLRRNARWSPISVAGEGDTVRNVTNKTVRYLATRDSSPRLAGSDVYEPADQPFTFTPELGEVVDGWDDADRTLGTQFKEASRDGRDFRIWPYYRFEAEFKNMQFTVTGYDVNTGQLDYTPRVVWTPSPAVCLDDMISLDVRRVGLVTGNP